MKTLDIHSNQEQELLSVLKGLVYHGENNSALVIGPRGSGKTFLVRQVLLNLRNDMKEKKCSDDLILVHLSGNYRKKNFVLNFFSIKK